MVDASLMRGEGWLRCCICGELHTAPFPGLYEKDGVKWDVCRACGSDIAPNPVIPLKSERG